MTFKEEREAMGVYLGERLDRRLKIKRPWKHKIKGWSCKVCKYQMDGILRRPC